MVSQSILNAADMKSDNKSKFSDDFIAKFHPYAPTYDPEKDLMQVEPALAIDLKEVYNTGIVPAGAPSFVDRYNDCDDPNSIVGRPRNDFDADRMVAGVNEAIRESKQLESKG